jgi:PilZ domain
VSIATPGGGFVIYSARARRVGATFLELHHLETVTQEVRRRVAPRVTTDAAVTVVSSHRAERRTTARDLSRTGVRIAGCDTEPLAVGERVALDVRLDGAAVLLRGEVTRVDLPSGDAVVRFDTAPVKQRVALDRYVMARLDAESAGR